MIARAVDAVLANHCLVGQLSPGLRAMAVHDDGGRVGLRFVFGHAPSDAEVDLAGDTTTELAAQLAWPFQLDDDVIEVAAGHLDLRPGESWAFAVAGALADPPLPDPAPDRRRRAVMTAATTAMLGRVTPGMRLIRLVLGLRPLLTFRLSATARDLDHEGVRAIAEAFAAAWPPGVTEEPVVFVLPDRAEERIRHHRGIVMLARDGQTWEQELGS